MSSPLSVALLSLIVLGFATRTQAAPSDAQKAEAGKIFFNEDDSARFILIPAGKITVKDLQKCVDGLEHTQVRAYIVCCCAQQTNFPSKSWEPFCAGFDPKRGNDQPFFKGLEPPMFRNFRRWAENMDRLFREGIDPTGYLLEYARKKGLQAWVSMRMNDIHDVQLIDSPIHSKFWREHPEYWRRRDRFKSWPDRALDYGQKPVRDHAMALIRELCARYDMDGLELDWMRFGYHFREGEEIEKGKELTKWMGEVRALVNATAKKRGHPIALVVRVPSHPDVSRQLGMDAITWAKRGYVDRIVPTPFWATTDFDIPIDRWRELLKETNVPVTAGLEARVEPYPGSPTLPNTPERKRGAAMAALARGSDGIYLFNYMGEQHRTPFLFKELGSIATLKGKSRTHTITFVDINAPGKHIPCALPKTIPPGQSASFRIYTGPVPQGARAEIHVTYDRKFKTENAPIVTMNRQRTTAVSTCRESQFDFCSHSIPEKAFVEGYQTVAARNGGKKPVTVKAVEVAIIY